MYDRPMTTPLLHFCSRTQPYTSCAGAGEYSIPVGLLYCWTCLELYLAQRAVEITYCRVRGKCTCRPANINFTRDL